MLTLGSSSKQRHPLLPKQCAQKRRDLIGSDGLSIEGACRSWVCLTTLFCTIMELQAIVHTSWCI